MMIRRDPQMTAVVALTVAALAGVLAALVSQVDGPHPGFFARLGAELPVEDLGVRALKNVEQPMRLFRLR